MIRVTAHRMLRAIEVDRRIFHSNDIRGNLKAIAAFPPDHGVASVASILRGSVLRAVKPESDIEYVSGRDRGAPVAETGIEPASKSADPSSKMLFSTASAFP